MRFFFFISSLFSCSSLLCLYFWYELTKNNIKLWENEFSLFSMSSWQWLFSYSGHYFFIYFIILFYFHFRYFLCVSFLMSFTWHLLFPSSKNCVYEHFSIGSFFSAVVPFPKMIYNSIIESKWQNSWYVINVPFFQAWRLIFMVSYSFISRSGHIFLIRFRK